MHIKYFFSRALLHIHTSLHLQLHSNSTLATEPCHRSNWGSNALLKGTLAVVLDTDIPRSLSSEDSNWNLHGNEDYGNNINY